MLNLQLWHWLYKECITKRESIVQWIPKKITAGFSLQWLYGWAEDFALLQDIASYIFGACWCRYLLSLWISIVMVRWCVLL